MLRRDGARAEALDASEVFRVVSDDPVTSGFDGELQGHVVQLRFVWTFQLSGSAIQAATLASPARTVNRQESICVSFTTDVPQDGKRCPSSMFEGSKQLFRSQKELRPLYSSNEFKQIAVGEILSSAESHDLAPCTAYLKSRSQSNAKQGE